MSKRQKNSQGVSLMDRISQEAVFEMVKYWLIVPMVANASGMMAHLHELLMYLFSKF